jgi:integrase
MAPQSRSGTAYFLREFLRFLRDVHGADKSLDGLLPLIPANKGAVLPSVYTAEEVAAMLAAPGGSRECPRRNRAVMLLAALCGLRIGDIAKLRMGELDWPNRRLALIQQKTKARLSLPLHEECALALADYLRNERPESDDPHVFITARVPHRPYANGSALYRAVSDGFSRSGTDTAGRRHGPHSLRHSLAVDMLGSKTPYPVISGILGHSCANTTKMYLRVDTESLRPLSLEVPRGHE